MGFKFIAQTDKVIHVIFSDNTTPLFAKFVHVYLWHVLNSDGKEILNSDGKEMVM